MNQPTSNKACALAIGCLLLGASPAHAQSVTTEDAASVVQQIKVQVSAFLCNESFYRRCFEVSVQQCQTDMAAVRPPCDASVSAPLTSLAQALTANNREPFGQFGRNYSTCLIEAHIARPQYNATVVNACLAQPPSQPPFRVETLIPLIQDILED